MLYRGRHNPKLSFLPSHYPLSYSPVLVIALRSLNVRLLLNQVTWCKIIAFTCNRHPILHFVFIAKMIVLSRSINAVDPYTYIVLLSYCSIALNTKVTYVIVTAPEVITYNKVQYN